MSIMNYLLSSGMSFFSGVSFCSFQFIFVYFLYSSVHIHVCIEVINKLLLLYKF